MQDEPDERAGGKPLRNEPVYETFVLTWKGQALTLRWCVQWLGNETAHLEIVTEDRRPHPISEAEELEGQSQHHEYNLLNADAVRRLSQDEALLVSGNRYPAILKTRPYFLGRRFRAARKMGASAHSTPEASKPEEIQRVPIWEEKLD